MDFSDNIITESKSDRFRELIEGLNVITYEFSVPERRFLYVSHMAERLTGYSKEEWLRPGFWNKYLHPDDIGTVNVYSERQTYLLNDHEYEFRFVCVDGSVKWFKDITTISSDGNTPIKQIGVLIDITDRKKSDEALKASNDKYKALVEQQTEMITRWKPDGTFTYVNDIFCRFFDKTSEELLGKVFIPPMPIEDLDRFTKFFMQLDKSNPVGNFTHRVIMPDNEIRWLSWTDTAIFDDEYNIIEYQTVGRDITEKKKSEDSLILSEEKYRKLIENTNVIAWEYDLVNKRYIYVSQQAEKILGYPLERWFADNFWFNILHEQDKNWVIDFSNDMIAGNRDHEFEYRVIAHDNSVKWFRDITSIDCVEGKNIGLHGILIDITDRKKIEEDNRQNEQQLSLMFENAPIGMSLNSIEGKFIKVNDSLCKTFGYKKEELLNLTFKEITHPDDIAINSDILKKTLSEGGSSYNLNKRYIKKDGEIVFASLHVSIIKNPNGMPFQLIAQVVDITQRKKAEQKLRETELRLSSIINNLPNMVFYENHGGIPKIAENIVNILGYSANEIESDKDFFLSLFHPEDTKLIERGKVVWNAVEKKGFHKKEYRLKHRNGNYIWFEDHMYAVNSAEGQYMAGFMIDVTERKNAEEKIKENEYIISNLIKNFPNIVIYHTGFDKEFISENVFDMLGFTANELNSSKELFLSLIHPDDLPGISKAFNNWKERENHEQNSLKVEFRIRRKDGSYIWLEDHVVHVYSDNEGRASISGFLINITDRKFADEKLEESQARLTVLMNNLPNVIFYENTNDKQFISPNIYDLLGYNSEEFYINKNLFDSLIHKEDLGKVIKGNDSWFRSNINSPYKEIFRISRKDGKLLWVEDHMFKLRKTDGKDYYLGVLIDISEQKEIEEKIAQSLKEKELLLKEIHHRVKNNLQVVSSLLKLQSSYVSDKNTMDILLDSQNRVRSMALVHQKLYQSKNFSQIDLREYINQLSEHLFNVFKEKTRDIRMNVSQNRTFISIDIAVPCGLIINELISNSLKYAFPNNNPGIIEVEINNLGDDEYELVVKDNGIGIPEHIRFENTSTLGLQLVNTLVGQIDGSIKMENNNGTRFTIKFKNQNTKKIL